MLAAAVATALVAGLVAYQVLFSVELDSEALNSPISATHLPVERRFDIPEEIALAAGISSVPESGLFVVSTDLPHSLLPQNEAHVFVLDTGFGAILADITVQADGDLEGVVATSADRIVAASEAGTLYVIEGSAADNWSVTAEIRALDGSDHKLGSLAYDTDHNHYYSAEKEGPKIIYQFDENGRLLDSFELALPRAISADAKREFSLNDDFTIAGMHYHEGHLYLFSEAYSTIFKLDVSTRVVVSVLAISGLPESAGITIRDDKLYLLGDLESYLPPPQVHVVGLQVDGPE